jgi:competence protein ComEC
MISKKAHISCFISAFFAGALIGIAVSAKWPNAFAGYQWLIIVICLIAISLLKRRLTLLILILISGIIAGWFRGGIGQNSLMQYQPFFDERITLTGQISEDPSFSQQGDQKLKLKNIQINSKNFSGEIWISSASKVEIKRSDAVTIEGQLKKGFGNFPAAMYRADIKEVERVRNADIARDARDKFAVALRKIVDEPMASLGLGFLVGKRTALPEDLTQQLQILGLTHIVVASGYNLSILVRFTRRIFAKISKYLSVISGLILTFGMIMVTGLSPSMTRAGLITTLCLIAWYFGRAINPFVLLSVAAGITALANPSYVWGDLGWYLSFAAFGGVIILSPLLLHYFYGKKRPHSLIQILFETISASLATFPIIAWAFSQYAPLALISNLMILPLVPLAMAFTFFAGTGSLLIGPLVWLAFPAQAVLAYMVFVVEKLSMLPIAIAEIDFHVGHLIGSYILLSMMTVYLYRRTNHDFADDNIVK